MLKLNRKNFRKPHPAVIIAFLGVCVFGALFWFVQITMLRQSTQNSTVFVISEDRLDGSSSISYKNSGKTQQETKSDLITDEEKTKSSTMLFGDIININRRNEIGKKALESNILPIETVEPNFDIYANANKIKFPQNISDKVYMDYYISPDKEEDYTDLHYSSILAKDATSRKSVMIVYSNVENTLSHYIVDEENALSSKINDINLIIYQWYNQYFTEFMLDETLFFIESKDLSQNEFINVLKSIIQ